MKKFNFWWLTLLIPIILGAVVAITEPIYAFERSVFDLLQKLPDFFYNIFKVITEIGDSKGVIPITALILIVFSLCKKFFEVGLPVTLTVIVSRIINITLKLIISRERPDFKLFYAGESSFPSGHAQNNMALYIAFLLALLLIVNSKKIKALLKVFLIALPIIIGITRIYFGVHYLSDVVAGWCMGALVAIVVHTLYFKVLNERKRKNADKSV